MFEQCDKCGLQEHKDFMMKIGFNNIYLCIFCYEKWVQWCKIYNIIDDMKELDEKFSKKTTQYFSEMTSLCRKYYIMWKKGKKVVSRAKEKIIFT